MNIKEIDKPEIKKVVVVYAGRFQPFHKGHYATYQKLVSKFGANNVYIGTSNDTSGPKSPFDFNEKKTIMNKMFGISPNKIVQVRNPYAPKEILSGMDGKTTAYIAAVGEKDATRLAGKYFKPYKGKAGYGYDEIGYVYPVPAEDNAISGTDVRNWLSKGDDTDKQKGFTKAYPKFDKDIFNMITGKLNEELYKGYPSEKQVKDIERKNKEFRNSPESTSDDEYLYDPIAEIIGRVAAEDIFEEFVKSYFKEETEAEKMGLVHLGGGYYGKEGQPASHKSDNGKIRTLTPQEVDAVKKKSMAKGPSDAPVNEPKPSQPGQPVNKGATAQGKVDKAKEEPTDKKGGEEAGEQGPPPEQKLGGAELKSSAEKSDSEKKEEKVKEALDSARKELSKEDNETIDKVNNPQSEERKGMMGNIKSGLQKFGKGIKHWAEHKKEMIGGTMDAAKALSNFKKIGSTKNKETGEWEYSDEKRKEQLKHVKHFGLDAGLLLGSMALGGAGVAVAKAVMAGSGVVGTVGAAGSGAIGAFTHGIGGFAAHLGKDIAKHAALESLGMGGFQAAGGGALLSTATAGILEMVGEEVDNNDKFISNFMKKVVEKMETYQLSDEQLMKSIQTYKKNKPSADAADLLREDISESKQQSIQNFVEFATKRLKLKETPNITLVGGREFAEVKTSLGGYNPDDKSIYVATEGRLTADILRTLAHEMAHRKQDEMGLVTNAETDGADGSPIENKAHAVAGILMREYGRINKQIYNEDINVDVDKGDTVLMGKFKNKKTTVKDIGTDDYGMPTINGKKATTFRIPRGEEKTNPQSVFNEVGPNDWHFKAIMKMWDTAGSFGRKKIGVVVCNDPKADRNDVARKLRNYGYKEVTHVTDKLGLDEKKNLNEKLSQSNLDSVERYADRELSPDDIEFSNHFFDRVNDSRNGKEISEPELTGFFKRLARNKKQFLDFLDKYNQIVVKDERSDINIPFVKMANKVIAKTVMRKDDFKTSSPTMVNELTQGLFAGKVKIGGQPVEIEVELLGADNKTKEFLTKVIHIDKKYQSKLPIGSTFKIPARIFRMPGGGWHKIKSSAFNETINEEVKWESGVFDKCLKGELPLSLNIVKKLVDPIVAKSLHVTDIDNLPKVAAMQGTKKSISTFNKTTKWGKIAQGKGLWTKGGVLVSMTGTILAQSIHDLWTYPDKQGRRWIEPGVMFDNPSRSRYQIYDFAPELKPYREKFIQQNILGEIPNQEKADFIKKYFEAAEKFMLSKKKEFVDRYSNANTLYYDSDWNEVVLTNIKIEKILVIPSDEDEKEIQKVKQKYHNVEVAKNEADIENFINNNGGKVLHESVNQSKDLIIEGGAYGHMSHPFDDMDLTFGDLKNIIKGALTGKLELTREKTDGQALAISWKNGRLIAARNKSHLQNAGAGAMGIEDVASKFGGRGGLTDAYNFAMRDLTAAISGLSEAQRKKIFDEGKCFMNLEVIWPTSVNVIPYGQALLVFHNTTCYDEKGSAIGANQGAATMLAGMIKQVNADVQSKYTIQGPPVTELPKNEELSSKQTKYLTQLQKIQFQFQLSDKDGVSEYHQAWWEDFVNKSKVKLQKLEKEALVRRWAFGDKSFRLNTIADKDAQGWAIENDKVNVAKQQKDNVRQFEEIFLGVGADVLSFMGSVLTVNPDAAVRSMKDRLKSTADKVRGSGDVSKIAKLKMELSRLASIGGKDKIVPNEGIVFVYKGNTYKLTGTFAPLNQILGIFYE
jgi:phosphopantetheine adenylyltransferase